MLQNAVYTFLFVFENALFAHLPQDPQKLTVADAELYGNPGNVVDAVSHRCVSQRFFNLYLQRSMVICAHRACQFI